MNIRWDIFFDDGADDDEDGWRLKMMILITIMTMRTEMRLIKEIT